MAGPTQVRVNPISPEELDVSFSGPAPAANRFFINLSAGGVRIAFTEQVPNSSKNYFRSAAVLSIGDAIELHKVLRNLLAPFEQAAEKAQQEEEQATPDAR